MTKEELASRFVEIGLDRKDADYLAIMTERHIGRKNGDREIVDMRYQRFSNDAWRITRVYNNGALTSSGPASWALDPKPTEVGEELIYSQHIAGEA
jgi:hypothetical protein